jgi:serine/threonine-protein kinase
MIVELAVTAGPHAGRSFRFAEHATFIVGRSSQAHFSLPEKDPHVSRLHLLVEVNPPLCRLRNMSAVNGTAVNGARVAEADLRDGDRITIGVTELTVRLPAPAAGDTVPTVALPAAGHSDGPSADPFRPPTFRADGPPSGSFAVAPHAAPSRTRVTPAPGNEPLRIEGYQLGRVLGSGGMGVVYAAVHADSREAVAVKTILPRASVDPAALAKFAREIDVLRRLDHPGVVRFRDSGVANGTVWFAMEFVPGTDAQAAARVAHPLGVGRAVGWVVQALEALAHAHGRGFVHRDVKPSNLLVAPTPDGREVVKLADFGLARAYEASPLSGLTLTGAAGGTPPFMPPEQVLDMRSVKPPADQYAASATLYRLLTGRHVYPPCATVEELLARILQTDPDPIAAHRPDLPAGLAAAVHRALAREPADRFPDCRAFAAALRPFAD